MMNNCIHNARSRFTHGFHCRDCDKFFPKDSPTYRSDELLSSLWCVLNNINVSLYRNEEPQDIEVESMKNEIGIGIKHENFEDIITRAETIIAKHGKNNGSATFLLGE